MFAVFIVCVFVFHIVGVLESKTISEDAKGLLLSGMSEVEVDAELRSRYGEDRTKKLRPQLGRIFGQAQHEAMGNGIKMGESRFQDEDEAKAYVAANPWMAKAEAEGVVTGAANRWSKTEREIMAEASKMGSTGGWTGTANDTLMAQNYLSTVAPGLPPEKVAALTKRFVEVASSSAQQSERASDYKMTQEARAYDAKNYPAVQEKALQLEATDQANRDKDAAARRQMYVAPWQQQQELVKALSNPKHPQAKFGAVPLLQSHYFQDTSALMAALDPENGDPKEVARLKARAIPIDQYLAKADALASVVSGAQTYGGVSGLYTRMAQFGADEATIMGAGKEVRVLKDLQASGVPSQAVASTQDRFANTTELDRARERSGQSLANPFGTPGAPRSVMSVEGQEAAGKQTAYQVAESKVRSDFVADSAEYLKEVRQAVVTNGRVAATPEQIKAEELKVATRRATAFVKGMGLTGAVAQSAVQEFTTQIMQSVGDAEGLSVRPGFGDMFRQANERILNQRGLPEGTGRTPPGALRPQNSAYPPANF